MFRTELLLSRDVTSRTYSFYYPRTRPGSDRSLIVSSTNANYDDWAESVDGGLRGQQAGPDRNTLDALAKYVPDIRDKLDYVEASTPLTFEHYTKHLDGASFGTKFEGLAVSRAIPEQIAGLYHAGSVGIIMSGWLGAVNYGVIVANDVDAWLMKNAALSDARPWRHAYESRTKSTPPSRTARRSCWSTRSSSGARSGSSAARRSAATSGSFAGHYPQLSAGARRAAVRGGHAGRADPAVAVHRRRRPTTACPWPPG